MERPSNLNEDDAMENAATRTNRRYSKPNAEADVLGPEEFVRRETRAVNFLRALLILVFIIVGAFLSFGSYKFGSKWEEEAYQREFKAISSRLTTSFVSVVSQAMWNAFSVGVAVTASSDLVQAAPNITIPLFDKLAVGAVQSSRLAHVIWSPLIHNSTERLQWEAYAQQQLNLSDVTPINRSSDQCYPCGSANLTIGSKSLTHQVVTPFGTYTCADMEWAAQKGLVPTKDCQFLQSYVQKSCDCVALNDSTPDSIASAPKPLSNRIYHTEANGTQTVDEDGPGPFSPIWQVYPAKDNWVMYDLFTQPIHSRALKAMLRTQASIVSEVFDQSGGNLQNYTIGSILTSPVFSGQGDDGNIIGSIGMTFSWSTFLAAAVPFGSKGIEMVLENSCGQKYTFKSTGDRVENVGRGDLHDSKFSSTMRQSSYADYTQLQSFAAPFGTGKTSLHNCLYRITVYSSDDFRSNFITHKPRLYAITVMLIFAFTCLVFVTYDCYVTTRQRKVMKVALQRDEIVSSLFPAEVQERLFQRGQSNRTESRTVRSTIMQVVQPKAHHHAARSSSMSTVSTTDHNGPTSAPIADFFPNVTVVFADISGFTAWSSEREPAQVFQLLETVYQAFDEIAKRMGIFKLETIGDCYVAAAGIPVHQADHAVRSIHFAHECILHMHMLTHELESTLGPSTSALSIRVGVHSGPVIAGVLRGEKSRFQLFGDTMNTTSRMQTTGDINMIQISSATAALLEAAGMSHWIWPREEAVAMKGKGLVQTYWVDPSKSLDDSDRLLLTSLAMPNENGLIPCGHVGKSNRLYSRTSADDKLKRLVEWNTDLLLRLLRKIVATRNTLKNGRSSSPVPKRPCRRTPFEEVTDVLPMVEFSEKAARLEVDPDSLDLGETVRSQMQDYVAAIASLYRDNPFHNFEHASHVAMSAAKVLKRIIRPNVEYCHGSFTNSQGRVKLKRTIHDNTFGISSDVLMQFAVAFSAVIHDVDHTGVSNAQLVKEGEQVAVRYDNKCVAEQNSVDIAWRILMQEQYRELLHRICGSDHEQQRFRQLLVNAVIATDIADRELQQIRRSRWDCAFLDDNSSSRELAAAAASAEPVDDGKNDMDRKATIVFEYIIQASDVAHTMQHWSVYQQWNERLFEERYLAYRSGREEQDPSLGWYEGEMGFFDHYIIPLAKKLETCGVFGVSSDEYLSYALENRREWELKGQDIVREMVEKYSA